MRGKAAWCLATAVLSLAGLRAQPQPVRSYRDIVEEFRVNPDPAIEHVLALSGEAVASGIDEASRPTSLWPPSSRAAAVVMHTDAALFLLPGDRAAAWVHVDRAQALADALARDPESAWIVHQWFIVINVAFKGDARVPALVEHWHAEPWYAATAAMDRGLDLESSGSMFGSVTPPRGLQMDVYDPDAFRQAVPLYKQAIDAHLEIAAVHLGRIEMLRGHVEKARDLFEQAAVASHWRTTTYLANLFLGSISESDGDRSAAERRYRLAVAAIRGAQTGRLALAALLARSGEGAEAARLLSDRRVDPFSPLMFDPWWSYMYPYGDRRVGYQMILSELHSAVGR